MVRRSMRGCESYSSAGGGSVGAVGGKKRQRLNAALSQAIVCSIGVAGSPGILYSVTAANISRKLFPGRISVQNIPCDPVCPSGIADVNCVDFHARFLDSYIF